MENLIQETQLIGGFIVSLATILTALTVITQAFTQFNPLEPIRNWFNKPVEERIDKLEKKTTEDYENLKKELKTQLKKIEDLKVAKMKSDIINEKIPKNERIRLAKEYLALGLNGEISVISKILSEELDHDIREQREQGGK